MNSALKTWFAGISVAQSMVAMSSELLEDIPMAYLFVAKAYQVPADILYSIALTESGKLYKGKYLPWPWALNIAGRSVFCQSQEEARLQIAQALRSKRSVDIGVMQISWRWQKQRFADPKEALIPMNNLRAGAEILREQFEHNNDWWDAVGRYHDPGQDEVSLNNAKRYREKVISNWKRVFM